MRQDLMYYYNTCNYAKLLNAKINAIILEIFACLYHLEIHQKRKAGKTTSADNDQSPPLGSKVFPLGGEPYLKKGNDKNDRMASTEIAPIYSNVVC